MPRNRRKLKGILAASVAMLVVVIAIFALVFSICRVSVIEVEGNSVYTSDELIKASGIEYGSFLFSADENKISENIISKCSVVRSVRLKYRLHNKLIIYVKEEPPTFYSKIGGSTVMFTPDLHVTGVMQNSVETTNGILVILPDVESAISGRDIRFVKEDVSYLIKLLEALSKTDFVDSVTEINGKSAREMCVLINGKYTLIPGSASDLDVKFRIASEYLKNERISAAEKATLDLSNPKEVIVTVNN